MVFKLIYIYIYILTRFPIRLFETTPINESSFPVARAGLWCNKNNRLSMNWNIKDMDFPPDITNSKGFYTHLDRYRYLEKNDRG